MTELVVPLGGVLVGYVHGDQVFGSFMDSLMGLLMYDARHKQRISRFGGVTSMQSSPRIASARNQIVEQFLIHENQPDWLLMLDTDMVFDPRVLDEMVSVATEIDADILGGLAFVYGKGTGKFEPTMKVVTSSSPLQFETVWDFPQDSAVRVDATGAACLLMSRKALQKIGRAHKDTPYPWFAESQHDGIDIGEDVTFCLRAGAQHLKIYVHTGCHFGHMKSAPIGIDNYIPWRNSIKQDGDEEAIAARTASRLGI